MDFPSSPYIDDSNDNLRIAGTRVSLSSVIAGFQGGETPEQIVEQFPTVTLAQAYGAIAYYLDNQKLVDDFIEEVNREFERLVPPLSQQNPELFARLMEVKRQMEAKRA